MPYIKIVNENYDNDNAIDNLFGYITSCSKCGGMAGGYNVIPQYAIKMMKTVRHLYGKSDDSRLMHIILSLSSGETMSEEAMYKFSLCIASYFYDHQVVFGVHSDTNHLHTHFMVNTVSFRDGSALKSKGEIKRNLEMFCCTALSYFGKQLPEQ